MAAPLTMDTAAAMLGELNQRLTALQAENDTLRAHSVVQDAQIAAAVQAAHASASQAHGAAQPRADVLKPPKPEFFHGDKPDKIDTWLFTVDMYREAARIPGDASFVAFAASLLKDDALVWWRTLPHKPETFSAFAEAAVAWFKPVLTTQRARDRMHTLTQTGSAQAYVYQFNSLALLLPDLSDAAKMDFFVRGLKDRVAAEVRFRQPATLEQAITTAVTVDQVQYASRSVQGSTRRPNNRMAFNRPANIRHSSGPAPMELDVLRASYDGPPGYMHLAAMQQRNRRRQLRPAGQRNGAAAPPHSNGQAAGRPQPTGMRPSVSRPPSDSPRCWNCGKTGHSQRQCRQPWNEQSPFRPANARAQ
jgi:hypothetical protein